jgi:centromere protein C
MVPRGAPFCDPLACAHPAGNKYSIENISKENDAVLFFSQARKIRMREEEEAANNDLSQLSQSQSQRSQAAPPAGVKRKKGLKSVPEVQEGEEEEADEESEQEVRPGGKGKKRVKGR